MKGNRTDDLLNEEPPPILSSWNQLYGIVLLNLVVLIIAFYFFTEIFS